MTSSLPELTSRLLARLLLGLLDTPAEPHGYVKPVGSAKVRYFEDLENNTHIIYPIIAVVVVALIAFAIISAWRSEDIDGLKKAELKREIIRELRREVYGMTADRLAKAINVPGGRMLKLLEEMADANIVESRTDTSRVTTWRMKGLTNG
ncbi:MAG: hypothetical protein U0228_04465 [Myxococcaceae bacterium]